MAEAVGPQMKNSTLPVGVLPAPSVTVTWSETAVPGATVPCVFEEVVGVVGATTWKHSRVAVVDEEARKLVVSGV